MANLNKVMLIGNLTRDVEMKYTPGGLAIGKFGLATNRRHKTESGEQKDETTFVDITLFGKTAELASQYLSKGRSVFIEGRLQFETWDDKQSGQKRSKLSVIGETMQFIGSKGDGGGGGESQSAPGDEYDQRPSRPPSSGGGNYGGGGGGGGNYGGVGGGGNQQRPKPKPAPSTVQEDDDDIPF